MRGSRVRVGEAHGQPDVFEGRLGPSRFARRASQLTTLSEQPRLRKLLFLDQRKTPPGRRGCQRPFELVGEARSVLNDAVLLHLSVEIARNLVRPCLGHEIAVRASLVPDAVPVVGGLRRLLARSVVPAGLSG
jgi:hypothetical protein